MMITGFHIAIRYLTDHIFPTWPALLINSKDDTPATTESRSASAIWRTVSKAAWRAPLSSAGLNVFMLFTLSIATEVTHRLRGDVAPLGYPKPLTASIILTRTACASPYTMLQFSA